MNTKREIRKTFDAVAFMRKRRQEITQETKGMTPEQEVRYFEEKANQLRSTTKG